MPSTSQWKRSGYCVVEWLPQIVILVMLLTGTSSRCASWLMARLWSSRIMAVNCDGSRFGALFIAISAFVLAGLPTTSTRTSRWAESDRALPWTVKIAPFADRRSLRSMPCLRGIAPTSSA